MKIHVMVFWILMPSSDVVGYRHFGGSCYLYVQGALHSEDGGRMVLQNIGVLPNHYTYQNPEDP
jgi:hypothetical protein